MNNDEMLQVLAVVNQELIQISVKGIDTIHMANALNGVSRLINILSAEKEDATIEKKEEPKNGRTDKSRS